MKTKIKVLSLLGLVSLLVTSPPLVAADSGWSAATLYDGKWKMGLRYDVAPLDVKGKFWVSAFASNSTDRMEQTAIGWGFTMKMKTETSIEFGLSLGVNANNLFTSGKLKGNWFVSLGVKL